MGAIGAGSALGSLGDIFGGQSATSSALNGVSQAEEQAQLAQNTQQTAAQIQLQTQTDALNQAEETISKEEQTANQTIDQVIQGL